MIMNGEGDWDGSGHDSCQGNILAFSQLGTSRCCLVCSV